MKRPDIAAASIAFPAILAFTLASAAATPAFAEDGAKTDLTLEESAQSISVTAPLSIPFALNADGSFTAPSPEAAVIDNNSAFPVAVESFSFENMVGTAISQEQAESAEEANAWWATMAPDGGTPVAMNLDQGSLSPEWNMAADGSDDTIQLTCAGGMENIDGSVDFSSAQQLGTITWHFKAGENIAEHEHNWVAVTEQTWVVDQEAWDEQVTNYEWHEVCSCGYDCTANGINPAAHKESHGRGWSGSVSTQQVPVTTTVHHDEVGHWEDTTTGYRCSICGDTIPA